MLRATSKAFFLIVAAGLLSGCEDSPVLIAPHPPYVAPTAKANPAEAAPVVEAPETPAEERAFVDGPSELPGAGPVADMTEPAPVQSIAGYDGGYVPAPQTVVVMAEPAPVERIYVYEPGYPPGGYFFNEYYWYGGHYYPRAYYRDHFVAANIRAHRYLDVAENRRLGQRIEKQHATDFGHRRPDATPGVTPADTKAVKPGAGVKPADIRPGRLGAGVKPADTKVARPGPKSGDTKAEKPTAKPSDAKAEKPAPKPADAKHEKPAPKPADVKSPPPPPRPSDNKGSRPAPTPADKNKDS